MNATQLMADLNQLGIRLEARGDRLRYSPRSAVTPELAQRMKTHKVELLASLRRVPDAPSIDLTDPTAAWQAALDLLEGNPQFPPDVMEFLRSAVTHWADDGEIDHAALRRVRLGPEKLSRCNSTKPLPPTADRNIEGNDTPTDQAENTPADTLDTRHWPTAIGGSRTSPATDDAGRSIDADTATQTKARPIMTTRPAPEKHYFCQVYGSCPRCEPDGWRGEHIRFGTLDGNDWMFCTKHRLYKCTGSMFSDVDERHRPEIEKMMRDYQYVSKWGKPDTHANHAAMGTAPTRFFESTEEVGMVTLRLNNCYSNVTCCLCGEWYKLGDVYLDVATSEPNESWLACPRCVAKDDSLTLVAESMEAVARVIREYIYKRDRDPNEVPF